jgi:hypothetical protein
MLEIGLYRYDHVHDDYRHNTYWIVLDEYNVIFNVDVTSIHRKFISASYPVKLYSHDIVTDCFTGERIHDGSVHSK